MTNNHAYTNYLSVWALLYIEQYPSYTPVNINIVCMVVVALEMLNFLSLGHISAIFIAHVRDALFSSEFTRCWYSKISTTLSPFGTFEDALFSQFTLHNTSVLLCGHTVCTAMSIPLTCDYVTRACHVCT